VHSVVPAAKLGQTVPVYDAKEQTLPPPVDELVGEFILPPSVKQPTAGDIMLLTVCCAEDLLALSLWLDKLTKTTAAKIPIIAITTKSSTRVKPFEYFFIFFIFSPALLDKFLYFIIFNLQTMPQFCNAQKLIHYKIIFST
jgi:hypothetical protein